MRIKKASAGSSLLRPKHKQPEHIRQQRICGESRRIKTLTLLFSGLSEGRISLASAGFHNLPTLGTHLEEKYGCKTHRSSKVDGDSSSYLQVLVGFQGPDGGVSEFDVKESLIWAVFVDFATGEPIPMLLSQRCHFYNWTLIGDILPPTSRRRGRVGGASTQTHARRARTWAVDTHTRTPSLLVVFSVYWSLFLFQFESICPLVLRAELHHSRS